MSNNENRLKELRDKLQLSGIEMASRLDLSPQYYYDLEKGRRRLNEDLLKRIALIFNVSSDYILGISTVENNSNNTPIAPVLTHYLGDNYDALPLEAKEELERYLDYLKHKYKKK